MTTDADNAVSKAIQQGLIDAEVPIGHSVMPDVATAVVKALFGEREVRESIRLLCDEHDQADKEVIATEPELKTSRKKTKPKDEGAIA